MAGERKAGVGPRERGQTQGATPQQTQSSLDFLSRVFARTSADPQVLASINKQIDQRNQAVEAARRADIDASERERMLLGAEARQRNFERQQSADAAAAAAAEGRRGRAATRENLALQGNIQRRGLEHERTLKRDEPTPGESSLADLRGAQVGESGARKGALEQDTGQKGELFVLEFEKQVLQNELLSAQLEQSQIERKLLEETDDLKIAQMGEQLAQSRLLTNSKEFELKFMIEHGFKVPVGPEKQRGGDGRLGALGLTREEIRRRADELVPDPGKGLSADQALKQVDNIDRLRVLQQEPAMTPTERMNLMNRFMSQTAAVDRRLVPQFMLDTMVTVSPEENKEVFERQLDSAALLAGLWNSIGEQVAGLGKISPEESRLFFETADRMLDDDDLELLMSDMFVELEDLLIRVGIYSNDDLGRNKAAFHVLEEMDWVITDTPFTAAQEAFNDATSIAKEDLAEQHLGRDR